MPADFTRADIERLARLSRLELTDDEKALIAPQLSSFLAYAEQVQQVATSGVPPQEALAQAPEADRPHGLFKVPRVIG
jgi:aspartyl/glutamyl-tRNA(Asn/Gln) amidotransferase C subunit